MKIIFFIILSFISYSQHIESYKFENLSTRHLSNSITDIFIKSDSIFLGTAKGFSISPNKGANWKNFFNTAEFGLEDISAISINNNNIIIGTAHSELKDNSYLPVGSGIKISTDGGQNWKNISQPIDKNNIDTILYGENKIKSIGVTTDVYNLCYDIANIDSTIYIASFAGMLRRSIDFGLNWEKVILPPDNLNSISPNDSLNFNYSPTSGSLGLIGNLNHRVFSVHIDKEKVIWVGTANGINKSTDNGISWKKFNYLNQIESISGNFVVAIYSQYFKDKKIIWAATINAENFNEKRGVSFSFDDGITWKRTLIGEFAHNFASKDSIIYVATDNGIFRSSDFGNSWIKSGIIYDKENNFYYTSKKIYSVSVQNSKIWIGGNDGLISTIDTTGNIFGSVWNIYRTSKEIQKGKSYAYPNPFSPDEEVTRIRFENPSTNKITIKIFDFGMNLIRTVVQNYSKPKSDFSEEIWDGKDDFGNIIPNGVYFYQINFDSEKSDWGKILVIQ